MTISTGFEISFYRTYTALGRSMVQVASFSLSLSGTWPDPLNFENNSAIEWPQIENDQFCSNLAFAAHSRRTLIHSYGWGDNAAPVDPQCGFILLHCKTANKDRFQRFAANLNDWPFCFLVTLRKNFTKYNVLLFHFYIPPITAWCLGVQ